MNFYSQSGEDEYIYEHLIKKYPKLPKTYIEVGALDGIRYSNTNFLEEHLGWKGVLIEPNPLSFKLLKENRPENHLYNNLISSETKPVDFRYFENENLMAVSGVYDTMSQENMDKFYDNEEVWIIRARDHHLKSQAILPVSLDSVIEKSGIQEFGFCSIDVEGHEKEVLDSFTFEQKIMIMLIEKNRNDVYIDELLDQNGYVFYGSCFNNNLYLRNELIQ